MEGQQASAQQAIGLALMQFLQAAQGVQGPQAPQGAQVPQLGPPQLAALQLPHPNVIAPTQSGPTGSTGPMGGGTTGGASLPLPQVVPALDALFPAKEELTQFGVCHDSSSLADDSPQWRWLRDITPRFMYRRSVGVWMKKNAQYDLHGHRSHPWTTKALTAQNWAEWKLLRIGLSTRPGIAMTLSETALNALFRVWESYGLGTAVAPQWTGPGCAGRSGGHGKGHGLQFFFKNVESVPHNWYDASDATNYNASPPSMVEVGGTISSGGRSKKSSMEEAPAAVAPPTTLPNAATSTSSMMRGVEQVCATSVQPVFNRVQPGS